MRLSAACADPAISAWHAIVSPGVFCLPVIPAAASPGGVMREPYVRDGRVVIEDPHVAEFGTDEPAGYPLLGLAMTRELLAEIEARGRCEHRHEQKGAVMAANAADLIHNLPLSMLEYRTVDDD